MNNENDHLLYTFTTCSNTFIQNHIDYKEIYPLLEKEILKYKYKNELHMDKKHIKRFIKDGMSDFVDKYKDKYSLKMIIGTLIKYHQDAFTPHAIKLIRDIINENNS